MASRETDGFLDAMATVMMEHGFIGDDDRKDVNSAKKRIESLQKQLKKLETKWDIVQAAQSTFREKFAEHGAYKRLQMELFQPVGSINTFLYDITSTDVLVPLIPSVVKDDDLIRHFHEAVDNQLSTHRETRI